MSETRPLVRIRDLHKAYGEVEVLRGIDADFGRGEKVAVIGTSGSGKSTLLRLLMTLEKPDRGSIQIDGEEVWTLSRNGRELPADEAHLQRIRRKVGMVFQHFNLFPHMTARQNITLAPRLVRERSEEKADELARRWLERVGLGDKLDAYPSELSGGQKQRVAIARMLAMEPQVLLLDEVTSGLDPELVGEVLDVLRDLMESEETTMLLVTHRMGFAREIAERVLFLDQGRVAESGSPEEIFEHPRKERTQRFLANVRKGATDR